MKINLSDLQRAVDLLIHQISKNNPDGCVEINHDYYWEVTQESLYDFSSDEKKVLTVGRLQDDWDLLQKMLADTDMVLPPQLMHVYPILRYLAYDTCPTSCQKS